MFQIRPLKLTKFTLALTLATSLSACQSGQSRPFPTASSAQSSPPPASLTTLSAPSGAEISRFQNSPLVTAINTFSVDFFQTLGTQSQDNLIASPLSAAMALSMTYNGASGSTAEAMAKTLHIQNLSLEELNQLYLILRKQLAQNNEVDLTLANGLWSKAGQTFSPLFLQHNTDFFGAEISELDFTTPEAHQTINNWVKKQTQDKITELVKADDFSPLTLLVLVNAIYFKGLWHFPFKPENTQPQKFQHSDGSETNVSTMHLSEKLPYLQGDDFQAVALPYGKQNQNLQMYLFRPDDSVSLNDWIQQLDGTELNGWFQEFKETEGSLALPRFKSEFEIELKQVLSDLGMGIAFDSDQADFSAMLPEGKDAYISKVRQKAFIEVNEEGSEAAAATSVQVDLRAMPMEPFNLQLDRPFMYLIREEVTGTILFMGSLENPEP